MGFAVSRKKYRSRPKNAKKVSVSKSGEDGGGVGSKVSDLGKWPCIASMPPLFVKLIVKEEVPGEVVMEGKRFYYLEG